MARRKQFGKCHLCGVDGELSFEHVPPQAAYNAMPVIQLSGDQLFGVHPDTLRGKKGPISQRGAGAYTLCAPCNNNTGGWYAAAFVDFALQGVQLLQFCATAVDLTYTFRIHPLRVIKQIHCMFCSANSPRFASCHPEMIRYLLNREANYFDVSLRVFLYINAAPLSRQSGISGRLDMHAGTSNVYSEIAFPPFGFILAVDGKSPDEDLCEITSFGRYSYSELMDVRLKVPVFFPYTPFPADFRSREEVLASAQVQDLRA